MGSGAVCAMIHLFITVLYKSIKEISSLLQTFRPFNQEAAKISLIINSF